LGDKHAFPLLLDAVLQLQVTIRLRPPEIGSVQIHMDDSTPVSPNWIETLRAPKSTKQQ
jgi:hypothetical protein